MQPKMRWPEGGDSPRPSHRRNHRFNDVPHIAVARFPQIIRAELIGSNRAEAFGLAAAGFCELARKLIRAGFDPALPIAAYRGAVLALQARSLAAAARLTVEDGPDGRPRFRSYRPQSWEVGPPIAQNAPRAPDQPPTENNAPCEAPVDAEVVP